MSVKTVAKITPAHPFEAYSHIVSPIDAAEGGGFLFTMPDIPGVMATISAMADMGQEVPAPAFHAADFTPASASGKVLARIPRSMHLQLTARAKTEGVSLNALLLSFIAGGLGRRSVTRG